MFTSTAKQILYFYRRKLVKDIYEEDTQNSRSSYNEIDWILKSKKGVSKAQSKYHVVLYIFKFKVPDWKKNSAYELYTLISMGFYQCSTSKMKEKRW